MPSFKVKVKWGKERYDDVELNTDEAPEVFKIQLFTLTGVPPERQKVMISGAMITDTDWGRAKEKIKEGCTLMLMGSADKLPEKPKDQVRFVEDMSESEAAALLYPTGLINLGNTCYMNSTVQCLKAVPELKEAIQGFQPDAAMHIPGSSSSMVAGLRTLIHSMDANNNVELAVNFFLKILHTAMPQFAERDEKTNSYRQQDAHECWSAVVNALADRLPIRHGDPSQQPAITPRQNFMDQFFGVHLKTTLKCDENPDEPVAMDTERQYQLNCFIQQDVKYMLTGLKLGLQTNLDKHSASLGRNAQYTKTSQIDRLPAYLVVQYMRFFVGKGGGADRQEILAKKVLKDVKFTMRLDVMDLCTPELKQKLTPIRERIKEIDDKKAAAMKGAKQPAKPATDTAKEIKYEPYDFPDDRGSSNSGYYNLIGVLTHQGRSSSSGHYVGWTCDKLGNWMKFDDDVVSSVPPEEVLKLSGGGDWHMAYILIYGPERLEVMNEEEPVSS
ncbi:ubiquitin carboxyl-terminal hydrolase 14-like [Dysidea avara]|uniref:ubiquitin carboxyl-terminal hydrolase 14-like n=1 Tax=Dysidea avara TaxID=196820 RepID=UPI00331CAD62